MLKDDWLVNKLQNVKSTQDYAKSMNVKNKQVVLFAENQTDGYGQNGNKWISIPENLHISLIIPATKVSSDITLITCIAVSEVILNHGVNIEYKWINDILIDGKKVAGILTEYYRKNFIIGIGVNIKQHPDHLEKNIQATNLLENGINISNKRFCELILKSFTKTYNQWLEYGFKSFKTIWKSRAYKFGDEVSILNSKQIITGIFCDIDDIGQIMIENIDGIHKFQNGTLI